MISTVLLLDEKFCCLQRGIYWISSRRGFNYARAPRFLPSSMQVSSHGRPESTNKAVKTTPPIESPTTRGAIP